MKKMVFVFTATISLYLVWDSYQNYQLNAMQEFQHLEDSFTEPFYVPNEPILTNPQILYPALVETAHETHSNLFRTSINYEKQTTISKYLFLTNTTKLWDSLTIKNGTRFSTEDTQIGEVFISSCSQSEKRQKGGLNCFGNGYTVNLYPFRQIQEALPVYGHYRVELPSNITIQDFLNIFSNNISQHLANEGIFTESNFIYADFLPKNSNETTQILAQDNISHVILSIFASILAILLAYYVISKSRKISIMKLNGFSNGRIWYQIVGKFLITLFICMITISAGIGFVISLIYCNKKFLFMVIIDQIKLFSASMISSGISSFVIKKIPLYQTLNKRTQKKQILIINTSLKICLSIFILLMGSTVWHDFRELSIKEQALKNWDESNNFGMFYPLFTADIQTSEELSQVEAVINQKLYPIINSLGSLYINSRSYEERSLQYDQVEIRYISVNPNYLAYFSVYDKNENPILISEQDTRYLVIVPEQYKDKEEKIREFFREEREWRIEIDTDVYHLTVPDELKNKEITILWSKSNQSIFSFNTEVFPENGNLIHDPIIRVVTENNSLAVERESVLGGGVRDPLKVKLLNGKYKDTYNALLPTLKELGLEHNLKYLVPVEEVMSTQLADLRERIRSNVLTLIFLILTALLLSVQNILLFYEKNEKKYILNRIWGYSFGKTYHNYFCHFLFTWVIQFIGVFIVWIYLSNSHLTPVNPAFALVFAVIEIFLSIAVFLYMETKSNLLILQKGI